MVSDDKYRFNDAVLFTGGYGDSQHLSKDTQP